MSSDNTRAGRNEGDLKVLFSAAEIARRNHELASEIAAAHNPDLLAVAILKGSFVFAADLVRAMHGAGLAPQVDFIFLSSYGDGQKSSGTVELLGNVQTRVKDREILLIDDILETGRSLAFARDILLEKGAKKVSLCVFLDKRVKRAKGIDIRPDHAAFVCDDLFVVGYGMDLAQNYRQLPFVGHIVSRARKDEGET